MGNVEHPFSTAPRKLNRAIRLTFSYENTNIKLISRQNIEKVLPPSDPIHAQKNQTGFWYQLVDAENHILYRRVIDNPIRQDVEVFSNDPKESVARQKISRKQGSFSLLVPDIPDSNKLSILSSPPSIELMGEPAEEIFEVDLKQELK